MHLTPDEIGKLSPAERLAIIDQLWDSIDMQSPTITDAQKAELQRRMDALDKGEEKLVT